MKINLFNVVAYFSNSTQTCTKLFSKLETILSFSNLDYSCDMICHFNFVGFQKHISKTLIHKYYKSEQYLIKIFIVMLRTFFPKKFSVNIVSISF